MLAFKLGLVLASVALCLGANVGSKPTLARDIRVVNGDDATAGEFPFLASLQFRGNHYCGCTILNSEWVLTAAHCIYGNPLSAYKIRAGTNNWLNGGSLHDIVEGEYHADYVNSAYWPDDIAVLKVSPAFEWSDLVQPTVLAEAGSDVSNETPSIVCGWGAIIYGGTITFDMKKADVLTYSDAECVNQYGSGPTEKHICAGGGGTGICGGDSGGPLLVNGVQVGITSWSRMPCRSFIFLPGRAEIAGVSTQVSYYRDWISERTGV